MVRPSFRAFFNPRPLHLLPMFNGFFVPFSRPAHRSLATPLQLAQNPPDVAVVVPNPKLLFDQMAHPPQGPQRRLVPQSLRPLQQTLLQPLQVLCTQTRLAPGPTGLPQSRGPSLRQHPRPTVHAGVAHFQPASDFRFAQPLIQQSHPPQATAFQSLKVSTHSFGVPHAPIRCRESPVGCTILYESQ